MFINSLLLRLYKYLLNFELYTVSYSLWLIQKLVSYSNKHSKLILYFLSINLPENFSKLIIENLLVRKTVDFQGSHKLCNISESDSDVNNHRGEGLLLRSKWKFCREFSLFSEYFNFELTKLNLFSLLD